MTDKLTRGGRPVRRAAIALAVTGLVVAAGAGSGSAENDSVDGRDPDAVPGAVTDSPSPVAADEGRSAGSAPGAQARPAGSGSSSGVLDNGRGGADPAVGPNAIEAPVAARPAVESGVDADSGVLPAPDAGASSASSDAPVDEDVPGSDTPAATSADLARSAPAEAPVDADQP